MAQQGIVELPATLELASSLSYVSALQQQWSEDRHSVHPSWAHLFAALPPSSTPLEATGAPSIQRPQEQLTELAAPSLDLDSQRLCQLIERYRSYGHLLAKINPLALASSSPSLPWQLSPESVGFSSEALEQPFPTAGLLQEDQAPLREILKWLQQSYSGRIGFEYRDLQNLPLESWLTSWIEREPLSIELPIEEKKALLHNLNKADLFEQFLHTKYIGQKRFSLEGCETLIPMLAALIEEGAREGVEQLVFGMAHRGRLNVLSNLFNKSYQTIFREFSHDYLPDEGSGDVKYHKGFQSELLASCGRKIRLHLSPNPSHLEAVNPVVLGITRAHQQEYWVKEAEKECRRRAMAVLIHGDGSLAGQGIVYEVMQLSQLPGYCTGGTIHLVINNQIGFTTLPEEGRSTHYCTAIARSFGAPVFHVNAEDPEACIYVTLLACRLRQQFGCDIFIDLNGYRKYGHNESDEPFFTQPLQYQLIRSKRKIRELYRDQLIHEGVLEKQIAEALEKEFVQALQHELDTQRSASVAGATLNNGSSSSSADPLFVEVATGVAQSKLEALAVALTEVPPHFTLHPKLKSLFAERLQMVQQPQQRPIDWGMAELLAYATLLDEGISIRLSGQDSQRGTFSHRHAVVVDQATGDRFSPLQAIARAYTDKGLKSSFEVINSPLSEYAVLGFEYGYSLASLGSLVLWEAQFGDFSNGAQVIIDQFIATAEQKWNQRNSLVLLLPHGYEGQGPEHSSARMERFLALSGNDNWHVVYPSTPAQLFHLLRRHLHGKEIKPLIVFTPKSLLRHPLCTSHLSELVTGKFEELLDDPSADKEKVQKLVLCTGKVYYQLVEEREKRSRKEIALLRIEQLYPLHLEKLRQLLATYPHLSCCCWVQEEPSNMGSWDYLRPLLLPELEANGLPLHYVGRPRSSSPATGSPSLHNREQTKLLDELFAL